MNILFICGSAEVGQSGVGDYTRTLAHEGVKRSHKPTILAIKDSHVSQPTESIDGSIRILQLPTPEDLTPDYVAKNLGTFDLISLQIVTFSFHPKGLPYTLLGKLKASFGHTPWQFMFHELWLGLSNQSSLKLRLWGYLQKRILLSWVRKLEPVIVHTQCQPYRWSLERLGVETKLLPLFGNITIEPGDGWGLIQGKATEPSGALESRENWFLAGIFGSIHPEWVQAFDAAALHKFCKQTGRRLALVLLGSNHLSPSDEKSLEEKMAPYGSIWRLGRLSSEDVSKILGELDLGLPATPPALIEKSGTAVAMQEHGLPLLLYRDDWKINHMPAPDLSAFNALSANTPNLPEHLSKLQKNTPASRISTISTQFYTEIEAVIN
jgi:hypothetical protein